MTDNNNGKFCPQELELIGNDKVVASVSGSCLGVSSVNGIRKRIIATESRIIIFDPKHNDSSQIAVPYIQLTGANYTNRKGTTGTFTVRTQSGNRSMDIDNADDREAINLIEKLKDRFEQIAGVSISLTYVNRLLSKTWTFHTPSQTTDTAKPLQIMQKEEKA